MMYYYLDKLLLKIGFILCCILILLPICCRTLHAPQRLNSNSSIIALSCKIRGLIPIFSDNAEIAYFIKVDDEKTDKVPQPKEIIPSNFLNDNTIYLLNAKPGKYCVVAVSRKLSSTGSSTTGTPMASGGGIVINYNTNLFYFLPKNLIKQTEVIVRPDSIIYMGDFIVNINNSNPDELQTHYHNYFFTNEKTYLNIAKIKLFSLPDKLISPFHYVLLNKAIIDEKTYTEFLVRAKTHLINSGWENIIQKRLDSMQSN